MSEPKIACKGPAVLVLDPGTYWWCACGLSEHQPFCDSHHKGSGFKPVRVEVAERQELAFCQCKHTGTPPFCDGTHETLA